MKGLVHHVNEMHSPSLPELQRIVVTVMTLTHLHSICIMSFNIHIDTECKTSILAYYDTSFWKAILLLLELKIILLFQRP